MENTSNRKYPKRGRDIFYFRQRMKNRFFARIIAFFVQEAEKSGLSKKDIATRLNRDPAQISRWLANPSNMTLETISDLLLAMDAEMDPPPIVRFSEREMVSVTSPLLALLSAQKAETSTKKPISIIVSIRQDAQPTAQISMSGTEKTPYNVKQINTYQGPSHITHKPYPIELCA